MLAFGIDYRKLALGFFVYVLKLVKTLKNLSSLIKKALTDPINITPSYTLHKTQVIRLTISNMMINYIFRYSTLRICNLV